MSNSATSEEPDYTTLNDQSEQNILFKKAKSLTGITPNEFIRSRRMKKAAELLASREYNVSEVAYKVGISDPFYFSKCFKAQYGCAPSKFPAGYKKEE